MEVHYFLILFIRPEHVDEMISFKISSSDLSMLMYGQMMPPILAHKEEVPMPTFLTTVGKSSAEKM